jgi:hypothetical protein
LHSRDAIITKDANGNPGWCVLSQNSKEPIAAHFERSLAALERAKQDAALLATAHGSCDEIEQTMIREAAKK